jgi:hypothetical protein
LAATAADLNARCLRVNASCELQVEKQHRSMRSET